MPNRQSIMAAQCALPPARPVGDRGAHTEAMTKLETSCLRLTRKSTVVVVLGTCAMTTGVRYRSIAQFSL